LPAQPMTAAEAEAQKRVAAQRSPHCGYMGWRSHELFSAWQRGKYADEA
jgi:hypothetical protein